MPALAPSTPTSRAQVQIASGLLPQGGVEASAADRAVVQKAAALGEASSRSSSPAQPKSEGCSQRAATPSDAAGAAPPLRRSPAEVQECRAALRPLGFDSLEADRSSARSSRGARALHVRPPLRARARDHPWV